MVDGEASSGAVASGLDSETGQTNDLKLVFTALMGLDKSPT